MYVHNEVSSVSSGNKNEDTVVQAAFVEGAIDDLYSSMARNQQFIEAASNNAIAASTNRFIETHVNMITNSGCNGRNSGSALLPLPY